MVGSIIVIGVGIFGTFTGYLANLFLSPSKKAVATPTGSSPYDQALLEIDHLKELIVDQQTSLSDIELLLRSER